MLLRETVATSQKGNSLHIMEPESSLPCSNSLPLVHIAAESNHVLSTCFI